MAPARRTTTRRKSQALAAGSWMALLAATSLGVDGANTVRAEVKADEDLAESRDYRLVVHSYDAGGGQGARVRTSDRWARTSAP